VKQSGIRLNASCSPFDVVPPELYAKFKMAVLESAKIWGLKVHFGQDDGTIAQAEQRYWEMQRSVQTGECNCINTPVGYCDFCRARINERFAAAKNTDG